MMNVISEEIVKKTVNYDTYIHQAMLNLTNNLRGFSEMYLNYTKLNLHRSQRVYKTTQLFEETKEKLQTLQHQQKWIVLSEIWCGDAAHSLPVMARMAEFSTNIQLRILNRDEHLDLMDAFLTNGGRAIPKVIIVDNCSNVIATWGPRPVLYQTLYETIVKEKTKEEVYELLQRWYNDDKTQEIQKELALLACWVDEKLKSK